MRSGTWWFTRLALAVILQTTFPFSGTNAGGGTKGESVKKTSTTGSVVPFLINHIFNYYGNDGDGSYNRFSGDNEGFEFPKGSGKHVVFEDGIVWGGFHRGYPAPKVGGSVYRHALQPGKILSPGTSLTPPVADDPALMKYRVYRVRPDVRPGIPFDADMEARLDTSEAAYIARYTPITARQIYDQYLQDWTAWPAADGAPFYDVDGNGHYDPAVDVPGVPGADQTLWYVANDLDSTKTMQLAGCPPIGLEMQKTIWGYRSGGALGNTILSTTKIINKSGAAVDSMFIVQWSDPDLGDAGDDYVGCDTVRMLGYVYNADSIDGTYGRRVPAVGFRLLEGPIVTGGPLDTATFGFSHRPGYRNLPMTTFNFFSGGIVDYTDPRSGAGGNLDWYNLMNGLTAGGKQYIDPTTNQPSKFCFSGDPTVVPPSGWVAQSVFRGGDVRFALVTGPISMADGDTQEVVVANLVGLAYDRLSSLTALKTSSDEIASAFLHLPPFPSPVMGVSVVYPNQAQANVVIRADGRGSKAISISAVLRLRDESTIGEVQLFDDGMHGDGGPQDGIFGNSILIPRQPAPLHIGATVTSQNLVTYTWNDLVNPVTTATPVVLSEPVFFSDNINSDGRANPGENIRYGLSFTNPGPFMLSGITADVAGSFHSIPKILPGGTDSMRYTPVDPSSYLSLWIPPGAAPGAFPVPVSITDTSGNLWTQKLLFEVLPLPFKPVQDTTHHVRGIADGTLDLLIVDPMQFKGHLYAVTGVDSLNPSLDHGITLKDSTDGRILLLNNVLPDPLGHNVPVTDGFKILGFFLSQPGRMVGYTIPSGTRDWTWTASTNVLGLEGFSGAIGNAFDHWSSGGLDYNHQHSVLVSFAGTDSSGTISDPRDPAASYAYRYLEHADLPAARPEFAPFIKNPTTGFAFQDFTPTLPFTAYDIDVNPAQRLAVGYLENNVPAGTVDGKYWPPGSFSGIDNGIEAGPREWFFIFGTPYSSTPNPSLQVDILNSQLPLMWVGYPSRRGSNIFRKGDQFQIVAGHVPSSDDLWTFTLSHDRFLPASYAVMQNFPNPFNQGTVIRLELPEPSSVTVRIYNILGQEIRTLEGGTRYVGIVDLRWDGTSKAGLYVASGVYIYRVEMRSLSRTESNVTMARRMMLLR